MEDMEPVPFPLNKTNLTVNAQCISCRHHSNVPAAGYRKTCINMGVLPESKPCPKYSVSVDSLKLPSSFDRIAFTKVIQSIPSKKLHTMAALLLQEHRTRRQNFFLGQKVYFVFSGGKYLENYRKGWVVAADKQYVYISAKEGDAKVSLSLMHDSVVRASDWKEHRSKMIEEGRVTDPQQKRYHTPIKKNSKLFSNYVPPTIDNLTDDRVHHNPALTARRGVDIEIKQAVHTLAIRRKAG